MLELRGTKQIHSTFLYCSMPLFQQSVLKKYINDLNKENLHKSWQAFKQHFGDPFIQQNIRNAKEEQYQEAFSANCL